MSSYDTARWVINMTTQIAIATTGSKTTTFIALPPRGRPPRAVSADATQLIASTPVPSL